MAAEKKLTRHLEKTIALRRLAECKTYLTELDATNCVAIDVERGRPQAHAHDVRHDQEDGS